MRYHTSMGGLWLPSLPHENFEFSWNRLVSVVCDSKDSLRTALDVDMYRHRTPLPISDTSLALALHPPTDRKALGSKERAPHHTTPDVTLQLVEAERPRTPLRQVVGEQLEAVQRVLVEGHPQDGKCAANESGLARVSRVSREAVRSVDGVV